MILHLTAGRGPAECRLAVAGLLPRLIEEARAAGFFARVLETVPAREGVLSALVELDGEEPQKFAAGWQGSLLWICPSPLRPGHRRKNWFVSAGAVALPRAGMPGFSETDLRWETFRSSGAGGQHVNTTDSAVRLRHAPSGLTVEARAERSQHRNRALALAKLAVALAEREAATQAGAGKEVWSRNAAIEGRGGEVALRVYRGPGFERVR